MFQILVIAPTNIGILIYLLQNRNQIRDCITIIQVTTALNDILGK